MPVATTSGQVSQRFDLKTLPDGFVEVRRMTYGEWVERRERVSMMHLKSNGEKGKGMEGAMQLVSKKALEIEFAQCITDHNLTDEDGRTLDFNKSKDFNALDPRIGEEISKYISEMNQFEEDDEGN